MELLLLLVLWVAAPALLFLLFMLPLVLMARSLSDLLTIPRQIWMIAVNRRLRKHHALEHATINILEQRYGAQGLVGLSREDGFIIRGWPDPGTLQQAAQEGLIRLSRGECELAIHRRCGSSRAVANFISAAMVLAILIFWGRLQLVTVLLAGGALVLLSPQLGVLMQKYLTTSCDVRGLAIAEIAPVSRRKPQSLLSMLLLQTRPTTYFVATEDETRDRRDGGIILRR